MNKRELLIIISKKTKLSLSEIERVFDEVKKLIIEVVNKGGEVSIRDFGKFKAEERKERLYRNLFTKRLFFSSKKKYIKFYTFKNFKYSIK